MTQDRDAIARLGAQYAEAWCSSDPAAVASHFAPDGSIAINRGDKLVGTEAIMAMAAGFYGAFPDLKVYCDDIRASGTHAIFAWTLEGHHSETGNHVKVPGWEEWELDDDQRIISSLGWFDAEEYDRQIAEGFTG